MDSHDEEHLFQESQMVANRRHAWRAGLVAGAAGMAALVGVAGAVKWGGVFESRGDLKSCDYAEQGGENSDRAQHASLFESWRELLEHRLLPSLRAQVFHQGKRPGSVQRDLHS